MTWFAREMSRKTVPSFLVVVSTANNFRANQRYTGSVLHNTGITTMMTESPRDLSAWHSRKWYGCDAWPPSWCVTTPQISDRKLPAWICLGRASFHFQLPTSKSCHRESSTTSPLHPSLYYTYLHRRKGCFEADFCADLLSSLPIRK